MSHMISVYTGSSWLAALADRLLILDSDVLRSALVYRSKVVASSELLYDLVASRWHAPESDELHRFARTFVRLV